jgi:hypothetical protein
MAEETPITTIDEAIESVAVGMVQQSSENGRSVTRLSVQDMIAAKRHLAAQAASGTAKFGLRMTKCIPPGGG